MHLLAFTSQKIQLWTQDIILMVKTMFSSMWTINFQMFKLVLEKAEEPEIKLQASAGSSKKQESYRKTSTSALLTMPKPLTVWITINCGKFWKWWEYQTPWPASWEICMHVKKQVRTGYGKLEPFIKSEVSQKEKYQYSILTHIDGI